MCVQLSKSTQSVRSVAFRISTENRYVRNIVKGVGEFKFEQNKRKDEIENKNKFIPDTGSVE